MGPQGLFGGHDPNRWEILHEVGSRGVSGGHDPTSWDTVQRSEFFPAPFFYIEIKMRTEKSSVVLRTF